MTKVARARRSPSGERTPRGSSITLYALVDRASGRDQRLGRGIARRSLELVRVERIYAVIERAPPRAPTSTSLQGYDRVVRRLSRLFPAVLPLRYGSSVPDDASIRASLTPVVPALERAFERVRDAVQFTLRVRGLHDSSPPVELGPGPGARWIGARLARRRVPEIEAIESATRPWVRESRVERHDAGVASGAARAVAPAATAYHLVAREDVVAWRRAMTTSLPKLASGVSVTFSGPWPPYAFAELL